MLRIKSAQLDERREERLYNDQRDQAERANHDRYNIYYISETRTDGTSYIHKDNGFTLDEAIKIATDGRDEAMSEGIIGVDIVDKDGNWVQSVWDKNEEPQQMAQPMMMPFAR